MQNIIQYKCDKKCCEYSELKVYNKYKNAPHNKFKAGVVLYDVKLKMVLLIQSNHNLWGFPKGSFKQSETKQQCALRELKEETGLTIPTSYLHNEYIIKRTNYYFIVYYNRCKVLIQRGQNNDDATGIGWFKLNCLKTLIKSKKIKLNYHSRTILKDVFNMDIRI